MRISDWSSDVCSSDLNSLRPLFGSIQQPLAQQPHRPAGRHATLAFAAGGAGDVQVRPALALGEARQEAARGDGAGPAAADVVDVGEARIENALVFVPQRSEERRVGKKCVGPFRSWWSPNH